jgi:hypothetical protein
VEVRVFSTAPSNSQAIETTAVSWLAPAPSPWVRE